MKANQQSQTAVAGGAALASAGLLAQLVESAQPKSRHCLNHLVGGDAEAVASKPLRATATTVTCAGAFQVLPLDHLEH